MAWASSGSFGVAGFIGVRPGSRWVRSGSLGLLGCALGVVWLVRGLWVDWEVSRGSSGTLGVTGLFEVRTGGCRFRLGSLV